MFELDQGDSMTSKNWQRPLADRTLSRGNDEHARQTAQKPTASFLQSQIATNPALGPALGPSASPTPASAVLPATTHHGVRAGTSIQPVENFEFKRRLQELESIARGAEQENSRLQRLVKQSQDNADSANARCIAESARANAEKKRADAARAEAQGASAQFMTESARANAEKKRAEEAMVEARRATALAEVEGARAGTEKERADRATDIAAVARNEAVAARDAVETASARALIRINEAKAETAQEKSKAEEAAAKISLLCSDIEALATLALEKSARLNGEAVTARANSGGAAGVQPVSAQLLDVDGGGDNDKGNVVRSRFIDGFCELVATATGRELPKETLHRLLILTPPPREGVQHDCDPGTSSNPVSSKAEARNVPVAPETPATASHAPASALAATRAVDRSTSICRVHRSARLANKEIDARRIEEERLREKIERCEGHQKRKEETMHWKSCLSVEVDTDGAGSIPPREGEHLETGQQHQQKKGMVAHQSRGKRFRCGGSTSATSPVRRKQKQARKLRGQVSGSGDNRDLATDPVAASTPADVIGEATTNSKSAYIKGGEAIRDGKLVEAETATVAEHDEAAVEEVPMPTEDMADGFLCSDKLYGVQGGFHHAAAGKTVAGIPVDEEGKSSKTEPSMKSSGGVAEGNEVTAKSTAGEGVSKVVEDKKKLMVIRRYTRSMRGLLNEEKDDRQVDNPASTIAESSFAGRCSPKNPQKFTASPRTAFIGPLASHAISTPKPSFSRGDSTAASVATSSASRREPLRQDADGGSKLSIRGKRFRLGTPTPPVARATHRSASGESVDRGIKSVDGGVTRRGGAGARGSRRVFNAVPSTAGDKGAVGGGLEERASSSLLPFGDDVVKTVDAVGITGVANAWLDDAAMEGSGGALTSVLAAGQVFMEKHARDTARWEPRILMQTEVMQCLRTLVIAIAKAESCARRHEARARLEAAGSMELALSSESEKKGGGNKRAKVALTAVRVRKRVKFCAFDLSTVDMPCEEFQGSELAAREVADCLARVVDSSMLLQRALQMAAPRRGKGSARQGDGFAMWKAFLRGVHTVAVAPPVASFRALEAIKTACSGLGGDVSLDTVSRAAFLLLDELLPLEKKEPPVKSPLRMRLAGFLSALIRFNLRVMFNPPPPKPSVPSAYSSNSVGADRSKVHEMIRLATEEPKRTRKNNYNPTREGATSAVLSRALRRLYGYSDEGALRVIVEAEAFVVEVKGKSSVSAGDIVPLARQHSFDTVDIVAAIRARGFVMELLEHPGVEEAIAEARGWGEVERLSAALQKVKECPDADAALSLLTDIQGLKSWLGTGSPWCHGERAKAVLTKLDTILVACDKKEAKRLSQEARRRMWFPRVVAATPSMEAGTE